MANITKFKKKHLIILQQHNTLLLQNIISFFFSLFYHQPIRASSIQPIQQIHELHHLDLSPMANIHWAKHFGWITTAGDAFFFYHYCQPHF